MQKLDSKIKKLILNNPAALATTDSKNRPNISVVAFLKIASDEKIIITDNYMAQTRKNILNNPRVCLAVWDKNWFGIKIIGQAKYYSQGKWQDYVKKMKENSNLPAKGTILLTPKKIIYLK